MPIDRHRAWLVFGVFSGMGSYEVVEFETGAAVQQSALIDSQSLYVFSSNDDDTRYQAFSLASGEHD